MKNNKANNKNNIKLGNIQKIIKIKSDDSTTEIRLNKFIANCGYCSRRTQMNLY